MSREGGGRGAERRGLRRVSCRVNTWKREWVAPADVKAGNARKQGVLKVGAGVARARPRRPDHPS